MKRFTAVALAGVVLLAAATALIGADLAGAKRMELQGYSKRTLENGLTVFVMETREVPLVSLRLLIPVGSAHDPAGKGGVANLTASLLAKGAGGLDADEIAEAIENVGGNLDAYAGVEYTTVTGSFMAEDLPLALDYVAKLVLEPAFPEEEFRKERDIVAAGIRRVKESPGALASREFIRAVVGDHPYGRPPDGTEQSVASLTRDDVVLFHRTNYLPQGSVLAVVGDVSAKKAARLVDKELGGWKRTGAGARYIGPLEMRPGSGRKILVIDKPDLTQSQVRIGNIAVPMKTPEYFPLQVANTLLGGGFTSRLIDEVRVNRGLTYHISSRLQQLRSGGVFGIYTFTKNETLREIIDVTLGEVEKVRNEPVGEEELTDTERYISGLFPFDLETNDDLAWWLTRLSFYGLDDSFVENYRIDIDAVDAAQLQKAARDCFDIDDCFMLILTNYEATKDQIEGLGDVEVVEIGDVE